MTRKNSVQKVRKNKLSVKKETLKDLSSNKTVLGGFIMKDSIIVRPTR